MLKRIPFFIAATIMFCACSGESDSSIENNAVVINGTSERAATVPITQRASGEVVVTFGNETLDAFDSIKCRARPEKSRFSVTASGKYQGERVRVVLMPISGRQGAVALNIRGEMWQLLEGEVEVVEDGKKFVASGTLRGKRMERQEDGTSKLVALVGDDIKSFRVTIKCP